MQPEIEIGPLTLQTFGLMMGLGFVVAGLLASRYLKELGKPVDWAYEMVFAALVGGIVGARAVVDRRELVRRAGGPARQPVLRHPGSSCTAGPSAAPSRCSLWARWRHFLTLQMFDVASIPLAAGYAIGRIGCQLAGDGDYGVAWDGPWAMAYPDGTVPTTEAVHPTPVYETLVMGLVAVLLWRWRHRWRPGTLFGVYLFLAGAERFLVEFVRRNDDVLLGLTQPQLLSVVMMAGGGVWIWLVSRGARSAAPAVARQRA